MSELCRVCHVKVRFAEAKRNNWRCARCHGYYLDSQPRRRGEVTLPTAVNPAPTRILLSACDANRLYRGTG